MSEPGERNSKIEIAVEHRDGTGIVSLTGELDSNNAKELTEALESVEHRATKAVVLDLSKLEFMDSTGLHLITEAQKRSAASGRRFALVRGSEQVQRVFEVTGLDIQLDFVDNLEFIEDH